MLIPPVAYTGTTPFSPALRLNGMAVHYNQSDSGDESTSEDDTPLSPPSDDAGAISSIIPDDHINRVLPIALAAALAMAATSATTVYAYADIICADPAHCQKEEQSAYAGAVALATGIANVCGILALGPLHISMKSRLKGGLYFWLISRATSVATLAIAGKQAAMKRYRRLTGLTKRL